VLFFAIVAMTLSLCTTMGQNPTMLPEGSVAR
jgi:hypothetical protein